MNLPLCDYWANGLNTKIQLLTQRSQRNMRKERKVEFLPCVPCATFAHMAVKFFCHFQQVSRHRVPSRKTFLYFIQTLILHLIKQMSFRSLSLN
jgi:hypothetical protein